MSTPYQSLYHVIVCSIALKYHICKLFFCEVYIQKIGTHMATARMLAKPSKSPHLKMSFGV